jgi:hypothetical protein
MPFLIKLGDAKSSTAIENPPWPLPSQEDAFAST